MFRRLPATRFAAATLATGALAVACADPTRPRDDQDPRALDARCPQTYEFGNYGCLRVVALVDSPRVALPPARIIDVRVAPADPRNGLNPDVLLLPAFGAAVLQPVSYLGQPPGAGDTLTVRVTVVVLDKTPPFRIGVPLPVVAADTAVRLMRLTPVGRVPAVDTVRLTFAAR